jgi:hypothetical protein
MGAGETLTGAAVEYVMLFYEGTMGVHYKLGKDSNSFQSQDYRIAYEHSLKRQEAMQGFVELLKAGPVATTSAMVAGVMAPLNEASKYLDQGNGPMAAYALGKFVPTFMTTVSMVGRGGAAGVKLTQDLANEAAALNSQRSLALAGSGVGPKSSSLVVMSQEGSAAGSSAEIKPGGTSVSEPATPSKTTSPTVVKKKLPTFAEELKKDPSLIKKIRIIVEKPETHHIATNKDVKFTPLFEKLFEAAEMSLEDPENKVSIEGHEGPHGPDYNEPIYNKLSKAVEGKAPYSQAYKDAFRAELDLLKKEVARPGSDLNDLVTRNH